MNYTETVFLPQTSFPMKASLSTTEPRILAKWEKENLYQKMQGKAKERSGKPFIIADGPPYANGSIHLGHTLNKILKDVAVKFRCMAGQPSPFKPGWDCHGLPIELKVLSKKPSGDLREACRQEALKWVSHQEGQFKRLGILADWENPYLTLQPAYEAAELRTLAKIVRQGRLYRGLKPVYWCPKLGTALAAAEAEYQEVSSPSLYFKMKLTHEDTYLLVWTTTPWTLPANRAVCLNENLTYSKYAVTTSAGNVEYWILLAGSDALLASLGAVSWLDMGVFEVRTLAGKNVKHPLYDRNSQVIFGTHVTASGTGCVHTAPGHGLDDYKAGLSYNLSIECVVGPYGKMDLPTDPTLHDQPLTEANDRVCQQLRDKGLLVSLSTLFHSYPHNPRTMTPLIFRATPQWFIRYDEDLRKTAMQAINRTKFMPESGKNRLAASVANSPDWCISRQRTWGVPIPVVYCSNCKAQGLDAELIDSLADQMERDSVTSDIFYRQTYNLKCDCSDQPTIWQRETAILDVWFDSGAYHEAVNEVADVYLEGSDQHRGWFQTSLMSALAAGKNTPFKKVITHGFVVDENGHKMSKSLGNVIEPEVIIQKYGAEILRLWVISEDFTKDVSIGMKHFERLVEAYRKIRNTFRFLLGALAAFKPEMQVPYNSLSDLDKWMLHRLNAVVKTCRQAYGAFEYHTVFQELNRYFSVELSSFYLDIIKGPLYTDFRNSPGRRAIQTVLYHQLQILYRLVAPALSFLAEEVAEASELESPFLSDFPEETPDWSNPVLDSLMQQAVVIRDSVLKKISDLRAEKKIGSGMEASVSFNLRPELAGLSFSWDYFLVVSEVKYKVTKADLALEVTPLDAPKCERCWVRTHHMTGNVCDRCQKVLDRRENNYEI